MVILKAISKAYRKLALKYHPDKQSKKSHEERVAAEVAFENIKAAYETLSNDALRLAFEDKYFAKLEFEERTKQLDQDTLKLAKELNAKEKAFHLQKLNNQMIKKARVDKLNSIKMKDLSFIKKYRDYLANSKMSREK